MLTCADVRADVVVHSWRRFVHGGVVQCSRCGVLFDAVLAASSPARWR